ncbi:unnamed protein product [Rhodiola kirilowii]
MAFSINRALMFCIAAIVAVGFVNGATHHHLAPAPSPTAADCSELIMNMADCLTYVSSGSGVTKPEGNCCAGLKTVLRTRAECLCEGLKSSSQMGIVLNVTKAATLPAACSLSAPSVSNCRLNAVTGPAAAPVGAPTGLLPDQIAPTQGNSGCSYWC